MASLSDEESVPHEESGRRTRSGRKTTTPIVVTGRSTRRSGRKQTTDQVSEPESGPECGQKTLVEYPIQSGIIQEMLAEAAQGTHERPDRKKEDILLDQIESEEVVETQESDLISPTLESELEMLATPDELNTPYVHRTEGISSVCRSGVNHLSQNSDAFVPQTQELDEMFGTQPEQDEIVISTQETDENMTQQAEDEKSCSFPFGDIPRSDNSDGKTEEVAVSDINDGVDSSLLASLVGDNANSLPSVGEESQSKDHFEQAQNSKDASMKLSLDETSQSQPAVAENLPNGEDRESEKTSADIDAEFVSEDELPTVTKPKVTDTEEVSDEELPAPSQADLPADTEIVSEDEFPAASKKETKRKASEGYDPSSPTGESIEVPEKKTKLSSEEREDIKDRKKEKRKLPDLEKYWAAVSEDPADFTGWTYLLQYVDQENDVEAAREAYDAFLAHYPYCYGYWRKYADYEKRKGSKKKCEEVFERGLSAIPLSVDLWIHYLTHVKTNYADEEYIRSQFERALAACGLEFRSDKLWEAFIKWETEGKRYSKVLKIYDRLLKTPTQGYSGHFDGFQDLVNNHNVTSLVSTDEFKKLRADVRESEKSNEKDLDSLENEADDHVRNDDEAAAIRDRIIASRRKMHKSNVAAVTARWTFEEGIKRPYFHVKPLERCQLKNWNEYLDFEIERGDRKRILILFERCLIACALYEEFWLKLIRYLESQDDPELVTVTRDAFARACTIHHPDKPSLHMMWSAFEECQSNFDKAAEILENVEKVCPNLLQIAYRRINLERRRKDFVKCKELYDHYISQAKNKSIAGSLAIKYARFCHKMLNDLQGGLNILKNSLEKDPANTRVALQMIDLAIQRDNVDEKEIVAIMDKFMAREGMDPDQKVLFAQRKVEFLEDFGSTAQGLQDAQRCLQVALNKANEAKKKSESSPNRKAGAKDNTQPAISANTTTSYNNGNYGYGSANSGYYGNNQSYQGYDSYGYNHWQQYGSGYNSGYSQWGGYGNYY